MFFQSVFLEFVDTSKSALSDNVAATVGGTVGSFAIVVIGVILAFVAIRYASK